MRQVETNLRVLLTKRHLKIEEVCALVGLSRATIYRRIDSGHFPKPVKLSAMRRAWITSEVLAWMQEIEEAR